MGDFDGTHSREFSDNAVVANLRSGVEEKRRHIEDEAAQLYEKLNQYSTEEESQCAFPFKRKRHVYFNKPRLPPAEPWQYAEDVHKYKYSCRKLSHCLGLSRRRVGRGGRCVSWNIARFNGIFKNVMESYPQSPSLMVVEPFKFFRAGYVIRNSKCIFWRNLKLCASLHSKFQIKIWLIDWLTDCMWNSLSRGLPRIFKTVWL